MDGKRQFDECQLPFRIAFSQLWSSLVKDCAGQESYAVKDCSPTPWRIGVLCCKGLASFTAKDYKGLRFEGNRAKDMALSNLASCHFWGKAFTFCNAVPLVVMPMFFPFYHKKIGNVS